MDARGRRRHNARMVSRALLLLAALVFPALASAEVIKLEITRRDVLLNGQAFGAAGPYEKLVGTVHFALQPKAHANAGIVDLDLAPRNARGLVEFTADFYLLKPVDPSKGNGRLFYEAGNRGTKRILPVFQGGAGSADPTTAAEIGNGALMNQGYTLLWLGWQWDVPPGRMRMDIPIATDHGQPITGLVRGNFIPGPSATAALIADRGHLPYPVVDPLSREHVLYVRTLPSDPPEMISRERWRFAADPNRAAQTGPDKIALDGGFEAGRIYDVVYRARDPRVIGVGLAGTRDIVSFFKHATAAEGNPSPGLRFAIGWGVSQTGRFLRHFVYEGFNADEQGRIVFDGVFDQVGGAGRGSFNHRFGQQSRDQLQHFNIQYPVDMFPFSDETQTDPVTGARDGLLERARRSGTVPKFFHLLTNSEYFNRAGSLTHTDVTGARDVEPPATSRIYQIASAPHIVGPFPPAPYTDPDFVGQADMNPLDYNAVVRALFRGLDEWVANGAEPPASRYPRLDNGTLTMPEAAGWPAIPGFAIPKAPMTTYRLNFGPEWPKRVTIEPPKLGAPFVSRVPAVDEAGNDRGGIRLPQIAVPLATHTGWNYRRPSIGAPDRLASEIGSYLPLPKTRAERERTGDARQSIEERYPNRQAYLDRIAAAARELVEQRYLLADDVPELIARAQAHFDWATAR
jgi:hypothetical protein